MRQSPWLDRKISCGVEQFGVPSDIRQGLHSNQSAYCDESENGQVGYSAALERKWVDSLKSGNTVSAEEVLSKIFDEIHKLSYNNVVLSVMKLVNTLQETTEEMNRNRLEPLQFNFNLFSNQLFTMGTLQEQHDHIMQICRNGLTKVERTRTTNMPSLRAR